MRIAAIGWVVLTAGCSLQLESIESGFIRCGGQDECPTNFRCDQELQACIPVTPTGDRLPQLESAQVTPATAALGDTVSIEFTTDIPLLAAPIVSLGSGLFDVSVSSVGSGVGPYRASYRVTGIEDEATLAVSVDLVAIGGAASEDVDLGSVLLDFTAPSVDDVLFDEEVLSGSIRWVDRTSITAHVAFSGSPAASVRVAGDLVAPLTSPTADSISLELVSGDGPKNLSFTVIDEVGNASVFPVSLILDTAIPQNALSILEPTQPEVDRNTDGLSVIFTAGAPATRDLEAFVASLDFGASWEQIPALGVYALDLSSRQDQTTTLWLRERDLFGNLTAEVNQAVLVVNEDSTAPATPLLLTATIRGALGGQSGVLAIPGIPDPNSAVRYEVTGGGQSTVVTDSGLLPSSMFCRQPPRATRSPRST